MAYTNGSYYCDSCGVKKGPVEGWKLVNSAATCPKCQLEIKVLKLKEKELERNKDEYKNSDRNVTQSYNSRSFGWEKLIVIFKWIFSFVWGGPYLIVQGYKKQDKFWFITGIEFTIVLILATVLTQAIPGITESTEPLHIFLTYLFGGLLIINIIALVVYWVKYREE